MIDPDRLLSFIVESNAIEGIHGYVPEEVMEAMANFVVLENLTIADLENLVLRLQPGARLRVAPGMDVRVGNHFPPKGETAPLIASFRISFRVSRICSPPLGGK